MEKDDDDYSFTIWTFLFINGPWLILNQIVNGALELSVYWIEFIGVFYNFLIAPFAWFIIIWRVAYSIMPNWIKDHGVAAMWVAFLHTPVIVYATSPVMLFLHSHDNVGPHPILFYDGTMYKGLVEYLLRYELTFS